MIGSEYRVQQIDERLFGQINHRNLYGLDIFLADANDSAKPPIMFFYLSGGDL